MNQTHQENTAKTYYDSTDADNFYSLVWGGEDIHIGLYESPSDSIFHASQKTVYKMISMLDEMPAGSSAIDLGSGYGGSARILAKETGCRVSCLNISEVENRKNRSLNRENGTEDRIEVLEGSYESIPFPDESFEIVWSQDAILHSGNKGQVFREVSRVLKKNGIFIFTDPMQKEGVPKEKLRHVLDRIHLDSMGTFETYERLARKNDLEKTEILDLSLQLVNHYSRVRDEIISRYDELKNNISEEYLNRMKAGLNHWIDAGRNDLLSWGILKFRKI